MEPTLLQVKKEDDTSSIQFGIFIPKPSINKGKTKKSKPTTNAVSERSNWRKCTTDDEVSGKTRKRARGDSDEEDERKEPVAVDVEVLAPNSHEEIENTATSQKKKRKRRHRRQGKNGTKKSDKIAAHRDSALEYLHTWDRDVSSWSFRKNTQYWLLRNMYDKSQIPKAEFKILLQYMEGLKGNQKQLALTKAQEVVSRFQRDTGDTEDSVVNRRMHKRALAVLKVL